MTIIGDDSFVSHLCGDQLAYQSIVLAGLQVVAAVVGVLWVAMLVAQEAQPLETVRLELAVTLGVLVFSVLGLVLLGNGLGRLRRWWS